MSSTAGLRGDPHALLLFLVAVSACDSSGTPPHANGSKTTSVGTIKEGVYMMPREVRGYSGETLELAKGRFRYWFYSDVVTGKEPDYPLSGTYRVTGNALILIHDDISQPRRSAWVVNGVNVLFREDGLEVWNKEERIHPYGVLMRAGSAPGDESTYERPSMYDLYSDEMKKRDADEYENRFNDQPPEVRAILRASTQEGVPNLAAYTTEVEKARANPDPKLARQLVALMGYDKPHSIEAFSILERIYLGDALIFNEPPPFGEDTPKRPMALRAIVEALETASDRHALENVLMVFLSASGIGKIDLSIPEAGIRIRLEHRANGTRVHRSEELSGAGHSPKAFHWKEEMPVIIPKCKEWCLKQLE